MTNTTKSTRTAYYKTFNFAGTSEWAIEVEEYEIFFYSHDNGDTTTSTSTELFESKAYSASLNLASDYNIDVNYNLSCINLIQGDNTTAQLEEYVVLGALKIDEIIYEYKGQGKLPYT